jgi:hypothetical protein
MAGPSCLPCADVWPPQLTTRGGAPGSTATRTTSTGAPPSITPRCERVESCASTGAPGGGSVVMPWGGSVTLGLQCYTGAPLSATPRCAKESVSETTRRERRVRRCTPGVSGSGPRLEHSAARLGGGLQPEAADGGRSPPSKRHLTLSNPCRCAADGPGAMCITSPKPSGLPQLT